MTRGAVLWLLIITGVLPALRCHAQLPSFRFETITVRDGLPSNTVLTATRDRSGFVWFGTRLCPVRYDGTSFSSYMTPETKFVSGIGVGDDNSLWLATDMNGICRIDPLRDSLVPLPNIPEKLTGDFYLDAKGFGWFSDRTGANRIDLRTGKVKHYSFKQTTFVWCKAAFVEDADGTLWAIGRDNGLFRYDAATDSMRCVWGADCDDARSEPVLLSSAYADRDGYLWIGTYGEGLIRYNTRTGKRDFYNTGQRRNEVRAIEEGKDEFGRRILWIGTEETIGVFRPDQQKFYFFGDVMDEPFEVNDIFHDTQNNIVWICTSQGIVKYHPGSNLFQERAIPESLVELPVTVNVIAPDYRRGYDSVFYLGLSHGGLLQWNLHDNAYTHVRLPNNATADIRWIEQRNDTLWIGTNRFDYTRPGVFVYHLTQQRFITTPVSEKVNTFFSVPFYMYGAFDAQGRLWVGNSDEGLHIVNKKGHDETPWPEALQRDLLKNNNLITTLYIDPNDDAWLGTYSGLLRTDKAAKKFLPQDQHMLPDTVIDPAVNSILLDHNNNLWIARWGSLTQVDRRGAVKAVYTTANGFYDRENRGLADDANGHLWMGNYEGLYCIFPALNRMLRFTVNDGLLANNTAGRLSLSNDKTLLFVGHTNGFNFIDVHQLQQPLAPPPLAVSSFRVHATERHLDFDAPITLTRDDNSFAIDFVALNFRKHHDNQYAYYLEGFEKSWNYPGTSHQAYYTNLNPGDYTLHLKTGDAFGNWSANERTLHITVLPAFYETWWFRLAALLVAVAILYALYRYRINQLLRLQYMRNRISADLHDELGSSLSSIGIMGALAQNKLTNEHPSKPFLERMVDEVQQISGSLDDIVWNISPKNDALASLIARMTRYASELFEARQIAYTLSMPEHIDQVRLTMEQRRNFYLVFKESVNNLVKYSKCTKAAIAIAVEHKTLLLTIEDNGCGFDPELRTDRNGLYNLRERAARLQGTIEISSQPGMGTLIALRFPLRWRNPKGLLKMTGQ